MKNILTITFCFLLFSAYSQRLAVNETPTKITKSIFTDDYKFDFKDIKSIKEIVSVRFSVISSSEMKLSTELNEVYNSLTLGDKGRIEMIVKARQKKGVSGLPQSLRGEDTL